MIALLFLIACSDYDLKRGGEAGGGAGGDSASPGDSGASDPGSCSLDEPEARELGPTDVCTYAISGFEPVEVWGYGAGKYSLGTPAVADLDLDGKPEIIANIKGLLSNGKLVVLRGDGSGVWWEVSAELGYAVAPAVGDIDGDGYPEIVVVREYVNSLLDKTGAGGDYTVAAYGAFGEALWESDHFSGHDFDYSTGPSIADMDNDGSPEIVAGRVILNADGSTRGVGSYGRGSYGIIGLGGFELSEGSFSAVADVDLDGVQEVVVGNALYGPDGDLIDADPAADDGMVAIADLDGDPEAEIVLATFNTVRAINHDFSALWGPLAIPNANIVSPPAIDDIDGDGLPEIIVAGGNTLYALNHDGSTLWEARVTDRSGFSGASIFDFEADGLPEVVYIDEVQLVAFDGLTGAVRFQTDKHASGTMGEYAVIADIDGDDHAEIVVPHDGYDYAISVYEDAGDSWAPARKLWNQHAYSITNIDDDLSVPADAEPSFAANNSWHAAPDPLSGESLLDDLEGEILEVCADCAQGAITVSARVINRSPAELPPGIPVALYGRWADGDRLLATAETTEPIPPGWTGAAITLTVAAEDLAGAEALWWVSDDDGTGAGIFPECAEGNNGFLWAGPFCESG